MFITKRRKTFISGTISALNFAIVYHAVFNMLVQANSLAANIVGFLMPISSYVVLNILFLKKNRR